MDGICVIEIIIIILCISSNVKYMYNVYYICIIYVIILKYFFISIEIILYTRTCKILFSQKREINNNFRL